MANKFIFADPKKCIGCLNCELACAASHEGIDIEEAYERALAGEKMIHRNEVVKLNDLTAPIQCMQCENAPCVEACPIDIIKYEGDYVKIYEEDCIGCRSCAIVCPFGAVVMAESPYDNVSGLIAMKCDLCGGVENTQACVEICPTHAIELIDYVEYRRRKQQATFERLNAHA
ncbi:4Fe-4S dicluster domain-containing protein [Caminibacter mediatlanticus]|uniref:Ferredoxin n=1 Tax=Caminibacter mediatlanticus TB-2 TaxID=391592 RepID=A0AAI9AHG8_9BACT|nr:4Fe-4S dicluster domain-containing protein [Caminibacter mediatlanticus]EDM24281.1 iron-sulfur cluster-binding protein CooF [Caminibacter mediatlanticus TB-2]